MARTKKTWRPINLRDKTPSELRLLKIAARVSIEEFGHPMPSDDDSVSSSSIKAVDLPPGARRQGPVIDLLDSNSTNGNSSSSSVSTVERTDTLSREARLDGTHRSLSNKASSMVSIADTSSRAGCPSGTGCIDNNNSKQVGGFETRGSTNSDVLRGSSSSVEAVDYPPKAKRFVQRR